ncbi:unnamed protein product [Dovyalis caffra]|uniref:Uncharacterized protein n=1 Tax=Dovyalis caffra TaxID=77055 RepID=A0AAV1S3X2_9ROSI|nr:unnamed protein product [Dovyalis caffra]
MDCYFVKERVQLNEIASEKILTGAQLADMFTKEFGRDRFMSLVVKLGTLDSRAASEGIEDQSGTDKYHFRFNELILKHNTTPNIQMDTSSGTVVLATRRENSGDWRRYGESVLVDESMIVLRKRIHEMKMVERNYEPPEEWMEWEKQCYTSYDEFVCKFVGVLPNN